MYRSTKLQFLKASMFFLVDQSYQNLSPKEYSKYQNTHDDKKYLLYVKIKLILLPNSSHSDLSEISASKKLSMLSILLEVLTVPLLSFSPSGQTH